MWMWIVRGLSLGAMLSGAWFIIEYYVRCNRDAPDLPPELRAGKDGMDGSYAIMLFFGLAMFLASMGWLQ